MNNILAILPLIASLIRGLGLQNNYDMFTFLKPTPYMIWCTHHQNSCSAGAHRAVDTNKNLVDREGALVAYWTKFYSLCQCVSVVSKVSNLFISQEALCTVAHPYYQAFSQGPGSMQKIGKSQEVWNQCLGMTNYRAKLNLNPKL